MARVLRTWHLNNCVTNQMHTHPGLPYQTYLCTPLMIEEKCEVVLYPHDLPIFSEERTAQNYLEHCQLAHQLQREPFLLTSVSPPLLPTV